MSTLEDKILGEKLDYYCSSSEDEDGEKVSKSKISTNAEAQLPSSINSWEGSSTNTGPKGVLKDWQRFKQLQTEQRLEQDKEKVELAKKLTLTCRSELNDDVKEETEVKSDGVLIDEAFLQQYMDKRMREMMCNTSQKKFTFGNVVNLKDAEAFLDAVDKEDKSVTVIVHLYEQDAPGCNAMNGCLSCLAEEYCNVKFCKLRASNARVSRKFQSIGLPALLVYKGGQMIANFVKLSDEFGNDFFATDVESYLIEHGVLRDKSLLPPGIRDSDINKGRDSDSD